MQITIDTDNLSAQDREILRLVMDRSVGIRTTQPKPAGQMHVRFLNKICIIKAIRDYARETPLLPDASVRWAKDLADILIEENY